MVLGVLRRVLPLPDSTTARSAAIFSADLCTERVSSSSNQRPVTHSLCFRRRLQNANSLDQA